MDMKKLLVSGCSFTTDNYISMHHPTLNADWPKWPELLARKLGYEVVNLGQSGAGQEYIFSSIYDYIAKRGSDDIGYVIAAWSQVQRRDFSSTKYGRERWSADHFDMKGDLYYSIKKTLRYYGMFQMLMNKHKLKYKHFQMIEPFKDTFTDLPYHSRHAEQGNAIKQYVHSDLSLQFDHSKFLGWPVCINDGFNIQGKITNKKKIKELQISDQDTHPNALGHKKYAEFIYENL